MTTIVLCKTAGDHRVSARSAVGGSSLQVTQPGRGRRRIARNEARSGEGGIPSLSMGKRISGRATQLGDDNLVPRTGGTAEVAGQRTRLRARGRARPRERSRTAVAGGEALGTVRSLGACDASVGHAGPGGAARVEGRHGHSKGDGIGIDRVAAVAARARGGAGDGELEGGLCTSKPSLLGTLRRGLLKGLRAPRGSREPLGADRQLIGARYGR